MGSVARTGSEDARVPQVARLGREECWVRVGAENVDRAPGARLSEVRGLTG